MKAFAMAVALLSCLCLAQLATAQTTKVRDVTVSSKNDGVKIVNLPGAKGEGGGPLVHGSGSLGNEGGTETLVGGVDVTGNAQVEKVTVSSENKNVDITNMGGKANVGGVKVAGSNN